MNVRLIAHRGYAVHAPQNSAEAFEAAGKLGFWAIETDVRRTADGVLVCCHDATVDSMFDGSGEISAMLWTELERLAFRKDRMNGSIRQSRMPTFGEYLSICRQYGSIPFIEIKTMDVKEILDETLRYCDEDKIVVSSSNIEHLRITRHLAKHVFIHHIFSDETSMAELAGMPPAGCSINQPDLDAFDTKWIKYVHELGIKLCLRAGDTPEHVRRMVALGLDYVPTNCVTPEMMRVF